MRRLLLVAALLAVAPPSAAGAAERGVVTALTWGSSEEDADRAVAAMRRLGVRWARVNVSWKAGEPLRKGTPNAGYLEGVDRMVARVHAAGVGVVMPIADDVPPWASADPRRAFSFGGPPWDPRWRPRSFADYADFAGAVAARYAAMGVRVFEVGNEPNHDRFWPSGVDAREFAAMLRATYPAIKRAAPAATVVSGGLSHNDWRYLEDVYAAGARGSFDAVGVHPYAGDPDACWTDASGRLDPKAFCALREVRAVMDAHGDGAKELWATEMGWSTCDNRFPACLGAGVDERHQAAYVVRAFELLAREHPYVRAALVYSLRNHPWLGDDPGDWEANLGLLRTDFSPKPAFAALAASAHAALDYHPPPGPDSSAG